MNSERKSDSISNSNCFLLAKYLGGNGGGDDDDDIELVFV